MKAKPVSFDSLLVSKDSSFLKIALLKRGAIWQFFYQPPTRLAPLQNDLYLGKVIRITPQFIWVDIGEKTPGVLKRKLKVPHLSEGQKIVVQVSKEKTNDAVADKGPRLSQNIYIGGKFCIYHPFEKKLSFSQNLSATTQQKFLDFFKDKSSFTFRTACEFLTDISILQKEMQSLEESWNTLSVSLPSKIGLIKPAPSLLERLIRDANTDLEVIFDDPNILATFKECLSQITSNTSHTLRLTSLKELPLFDYFGVQEEWEMLTESLVSLPSGGNLYIEETACVTTIDVNAGEKSPEEINFESIKPIIKQIRLRQLNGNILIDFVRLPYNARKKLLNEFESCLRNENPQNIKIMGWSHLGFLELQAPRHHDSLTKQLVQK